MTRRPITPSRLRRLVLSAAAGGLTGIFVSLGLAATGLPEAPAALLGLPAWAAILSLGVRS